MGTLNEEVKICVSGQKVIFFTLSIKRETGTESDNVECKVFGVNADIFEHINVPGTTLTVMGRLTTKEDPDGQRRTGVSVVHISDGDLFDVSAEPDSCRIRRIARMYDDGDSDSQWTPELLEEYDHANRTERAYMRGKYGTPPTL